MFTGVVFTVIKYCRQLNISAILLYIKRQYYLRQNQRHIYICVFFILEPRLNRYLA